MAGQAPTSGGPLAFVLPVVATIAWGEPNRPRALVLSPGRGLASHIAAELTPLFATRSLTVNAFNGGVVPDPSLPSCAVGAALAREGSGHLHPCPGSVLEKEAPGMAPGNEAVHTFAKVTGRPAPRPWPGFSPVLAGKACSTGCGPGALVTAAARADPSGAVEAIDRR